MPEDHLTMVSERSFRDKITVTSFACILIVLLIHTYNADVYGLSPESGGLGSFAYWLESTISRITPVGVPFFFVISGYLFFRTFSFANLKSKYVSRIKTIAIPYFLWNTIYYLYFVSLTSIPFFASKMNSERVPFDLITWLKWLWPTEYYIFWFLQDLMVMIAVAPLLYLILKNHFKYSGFICLAALYVISGGIIGIKIPYFNYYFAVGAFIGINYKDIPKMHSDKITLISRIIVLLLLADCIIRTCFGSSLCTAEIILFCLAVWESFQMPERHKPLPMLVSISFFIYCCHDAVLEGIEKILLIVLGISPAAALINYISAPVISLMIILIIAKLLKMLPPVWNVLTGSRG